MAVFATLVIGIDGSTTKAGTSRAITSQSDRHAFLERRRSVDFILIGGETARNEPYQRTPVPVVVASRSLVNSLADNRLAHWWNCSPMQALERGIAKFGSNVLVEAGVSIIEELIDQRALDGLYLSITSESGGEYPVNYQELIAKFISISSIAQDGTTFIEAKTLK